MDWVYNEEQQIGTNYDDLKEVETYDEKMQDLRELDEEAEEIIQLTNIDNTATVLDIGTGTGELAIKIADYCKKIYAVDISTTMLDYAVQKADRRQVVNIEFRQAGFLTCDFAQNSIDVVMTQLALHHLTDFWKQIALNRIFKLLSRGGRLYLHDVVFNFDADNYEENINNFIRLTRENSGEKMAEETKAHIREEYSTFSWVLEEMIQKAGFSLERVDYEEKLFGTYVCKKK